MTTPAAPAAPAAPATGASSAPSPATPAPIGAPAPAPSGTSTPGTPPAKPPAPGAQQTAARLKRKEVVNGKELELEATEDELWASHRKVRAADQRFEEAARLRKEAQEKLSAQAQLQRALQEDPRAVVSFLREQGIDDPVGFIANALQAEIAEEEKLADPNVRARIDAERRAEELEKRQRQMEIDQQVQEFESRVEVEREAIGKLFTDALTELGDVPADDDTLQIMAQLESTNRRRGLKISAAQLAAETRERVMVRGLSALKKLDPARLLALDPEFTKVFRAALTAEFKARRASPAPPPPSQNAPVQPAPAPGQKRLISDKEELELIAPGRRQLRTI